MITLSRCFVTCYELGYWLISHWIGAWSVS